MARQNFYAVILSGGSGERFWPLSTPERPKQFLTVFGGKSLLRQAVERLRGLVPPERILVVTAESLAAATKKELPELPAGNIVAEPCRRDTAAAVATACGVVEARGGENAVAAILTADHIMRDKAAFRKVLADAACAAAKTGCIVTMGVAPDCPATGFGYIRVGGPVKTGTTTKFSSAEKFVEKPDLATARRYLASGKYVWNAGMFVWSVSTMKKALLENVPGLAILEATVASARTPRRIQKALATYYPQLPKISIDYAVMERVRYMLVSRSAFGWDDVGTWSSASRHLPLDACRNVSKGDVALLDVADSTVISTGPRIAAMGVEGLVVVATKDSVLVADKSRAQDLKKLLAKAKAVWG